MSWVTIIWSMNAGACLSMAALYLLAWAKQRAPWANLHFSCAAVSTAAMVFCELGMMHAQTPGQFGTALRWLHVAAFVVVLSLIAFVFTYTGAGRPWLGWAVCSLRALSLLLNFLTGQNLNYREVTGLRHIPFLGESVAVGEGVSNPWMLVGQLSLVLFVVFVADAAITMWRRGQRRSLLVMGGSMVFFSLASTVQAVLALWQIVPAPLTPSLFYMGIMATMTYEMSREALLARRLASELRESEQQMALATEAANLGVWVRDFPGDEFWASDSWRALFGFPPAEPLDIGKLLQRLHPDDRDSIRLALTKATAGNGRYEAEYRLVLPDGQTRWIVSRGRVEFDGGGNPTRVRGVAIDVTVRREALEELRKSEERFRAVVEQASDGFELLDSDGRFLEVNEASLRQLGYTREELRRLTIFDVDPMLDRDRFESDGETIMAGKPLQLETIHRRKDGTTFPVDVSISNLQVGDRMHRFALVRDITARKQAEAEAVRQRAELTHLSRVNTLGELAGSLAHELNQPLTAILSNAQAAQRFLAHGVPDLGEINEILADIVAQDKRAGEVIRRLRLLLKKGEVRHQPLVLNDLVVEVLKLMHSDLLNYGVIVRTEFAENLPVLAGDRVQLQQVLINLIINATEAMAGTARSERRLTIRTSPAGPDSVCISVVDVGTGIHPEKLEQIFEPYFSSKQDGLGLGLAVCRSIITAHGGRLWATNNPDRGAAVHMTLPLNAALLEPAGQT
jgi:two-component system, LuxR family, sensor kinase FixL